MNLIRFNSIPRDLFDTIDQIWNREMTTFGWHLPAVNIKEAQNGYIIEVAVPGLKKDDVKVSLENDILTINYEHTTEKTANEERFTRREFGYRSFKRSFTLPDSIDKEAILGDFKDGILSIQLPKKTLKDVKTSRVIEVL